MNLGTPKLSDIEELRMMLYYYDNKAERNYKCECGKCYLSFAALYTHKK